MAKKNKKIVEQPVEEVVEKVVEEPIEIYGTLEGDEDEKDG